MAITWAIATAKTEKAIGNFYVSIGGDKPVAYDLPGGAMAMVFTGHNVQHIPDGQGGIFIVGTFDLDINGGDRDLSVVCRWS